MTTAQSLISLISDISIKTFSINTECFKTNDSGQLFKRIKNITSGLFLFKGKAKRQESLGPVVLTTADLVEAAERGLQKEGACRAEPLFRKAVESLSQCSGTEPITALRAFAGLAHCLDEQSQKEESIRFYEQANLLLQKHGVGLDWKTAASVLNNLSILYREMNRFEDAEGCLVKVINELEHSLRAPGVEAVLTTLYETLANLYHRSGHGSAAEEMRSKAMTLQEKSSKMSPESRFESLCALAQLRFSAGNPEEAVETFKKALKSLEQVHSPDDMAVVEALFSLGLACNACGKHADAISALKQALNTLTHISSPDDLLRAHVLSALGNAFLAKGNAADAYLAFLEANRISHSAITAEDSLRLETIANLAAACEIQGRLVEGAALRDESVRMAETAVRSLSDKVRSVVLPVLRNGNTPKVPGTLIAPPISRSMEPVSIQSGQNFKYLPLRTETIDLDLLMEPELLELEAAATSRQPESCSKLAIHQSEVSPPTRLYTWR